MSLMAMGSTFSGFLSRITRSAILPASSEPLDASSSSALPRDAVDRRPHHEHLVERRHVEVGVVGRVQTGIDRIAHRAEVCRLLRPRFFLWAVAK